MERADLTNPIFTNEDAAWAHYEAARWPEGPICPKCGSVNNAAKLEAKTVRRTRKNTKGEEVVQEWARRGVHKCRDCSEQFTATMGTVFESSHIPMHKWLLAMHLMCASKKGMSAAQLHRMMGFGSYRTAWFMAMRIREAMADRGMLPPMGGEGQIVEADETYYGRSQEAPLYKSRSTSRRKHKDQRPKRAVVALVERGGNVRTFHVASADKKTVTDIVSANVHPLSRLHTDESKLYTGSDARFASHETVKHSAGEYVRGDVHTNSAEGFFGVFKKGMTGVYQHCAEKYLARYLDEFSFRHNTRTKLGFTDKERAALALKGAAGKRLTLRPPQNSVA